MMDLDDAYMNRIARMQYPGDLEAEAQGEATGLEQAAQQALVGTLPQPFAPAPEPMSQPTGSIREIPRNMFEQALGRFGEALTAAGVQLDKVGIDIPALGRVTLKDLTVGDVGKVIEDMSYGFPPTRGAGGIGGTSGLKPEATELLNLPIVGTAARATGTVAAAGAKFAAPKVGEMLDSYMRRTGMTMNIAPINPSDFNPAQEIKIAVDAIQSDPKKVIYLPQAERAPAVALRITQPKVAGTGERGVVTVADVGSVLEKSQVEFNGGKVLDPTNPQDLSKMIDSASAEAEFQLSQPISGATWYEDDVSKAFELSSKIVPQLATDEDLRVLTTAFAASTSYNKRAGDNWAVATKIADHLMKTGTVAARNPDNGKLWGGTTGPIMEQQLKLHEYMINKMGIDKYAEWLLTPHTVKEIAAMKMESGLYKSPGVPGKANDMKMGSFIMGEKGGAFFLNLNGIKETTADKWFSRTYNRHTGTLTSGQLSEQGVVDKPRNEGERALMKTWNRAVADNVKLNEQANQAVLWYFEQNLYYNLGVKAAKSESFSDGAKNLLNARGIPFDDVAQPGAAGGSNAPQVGGKPQSATAAGNPVSSGAVAATQSTTPSTVKRGKGAPQSGAQ
jgi:hypothetical protein